MAADLHMHTEASDGENSVDERIQQARNHDLDVIAITDHDIINSGLQERVMSYGDVEVISGAEIKCQQNGTGIEILGYFIDPNDEDLHSIFDRLERFREVRMEEMVQNVNQELGSDLTYEQVEDLAEGSVGRPHLARVMKNEGLVESSGEAFERYIGDNSPCYLETEKLPASEVIETLHKNGAATSLAHPGRDLETENAEEIIRELVDNNLDALEVPYTYNHKRQDGYEINFGIMKAYQLAEKFDLAITGGSDCHGEGTDKFNIGKIALDYEHVQELRDISESWR